MEFPIIHTNFWDAVIAIPAVMVLTQIIKIFFRIKKALVPTIALALGLFISIFISHKDNLVAGIFMGYFYGYAAVGNYAALKTALLVFRKQE